MSSLDGRRCRLARDAPPGDYPYVIRGQHLFGDGAVLLLEHVATNTLRIVNFDDVQLAPEP